MSSVIQEFKNSAIKITIYFFPTIICCQKIEIYINRIQKFTISTPDIVLTHITSAANLTTFQKGPFYFGIKVFNHLPTSIKKTSHDMNQFKSVLKSYLLVNSFSSLEEYFAWNSDRDPGSVLSF